MSKQPAVFLDRDGTIIKDVGHINHSSLVEFYSFSIPALQKLQDYYLLFIITNQSGISKGILTENDVKSVNSYIEATLANSNITINKTFYCPHQNKDNCDCKKPNPYFINHAASLYSLDLSKSFFVGDHPSDIECGLNAGVTPIYLLSGHGNEHRNELMHKVQVCENILDASELILSNNKTKLNGGFI